MNVNRRQSSVTAMAVMAVLVTALQATAQQQQTTTQSQRKASLSWRE